MGKKRSIVALWIALFCLGMAGCGASVSESSPPPQSVPETTSPESAQAVLYVGMDGDFREYPFSYEGELTPELLIRGIADLTGWDLSLADVVTTGKGGMTVSFAKTGSLFVGPPDPQKEAFYVFDVVDLAHTILDSVKKTLQMNYTGQGGNPDLLDIYYCAEENQPLTLESIGRTWTLDAPYVW